MQSVSRRAFFGGHRPTVNAWERFCLQLERKTGTQLERLSNEAQAEQARFTPRTGADIHHARDLCATYQVCMALDGVPHATTDMDQPVLWVNPQPHLNSFERLSSGSNQWFVQPGCLVGELEAAGFSAFSSLPANLSVGAWLADRSCHTWATGQTHHSGVVHASLLMAEGSVASLGLFGVSNTKPLNCATLRKLVPQLFTLTASASAVLCLQTATWPGRYRLDALQPADNRELNLAHLILGSGGDLGWVEWVVIDETQLQIPPAVASPQFVLNVDSNLQLHASEVDAAIKQDFDPQGVFPHPGQAL